MRRPRSWFPAKAARHRPPPCAIVGAIQQGSERMPTTAKQLPRSRQRRRAENLRQGGAGDGRQGRRAGRCPRQRRGRGRPARPPARSTFRAARWSSRPISTSPTAREEPGVRQAGDPALRLRRARGAGGQAAQGYGLTDVTTSAASRTGSRPAATSTSRARRSRRRATHSASCPGLARATMRRRNGHNPTVCER